MHSHLRWGHQVLTAPFSRLEQTQWCLCVLSPETIQQQAGCHDKRTPLCFRGYQNITVLGLVNFMEQLTIKGKYFRTISLFCTEHRPVQCESKSLCPSPHCHIWAIDDDRPEVIKTIHRFLFHWHFGTNSLFNTGGAWYWRGCTAAARLVFRLCFVSEPY